MDASGSIWSVPLALILTASSCWGRQTSLQGVDLSLTTRTSDELAIDAYVLADQSCAPTEFPEIVLVKSPDHGIVCSRIENFVVESDTFRDRACIGHIARGVTVFYQARSGYVGPDSVRYSVTGSVGRFDVSVKLSVVPDTSAPPPAPNAAELPAVMSPGPLPICVAPVS